MGWYLKMTSIRGYDTRDEPPAPGEERSLWAASHGRLLHRRGHWSPAACLRLGRKNGIVTDIQVEHTTSDLNGKGYGGIDRRFSVNETEVVEHAVSLAQNDAFAQSDLDSVWDIHTSVPEGHPH